MKIFALILGFSLIANFSFAQIDPAKEAVKKAEKKVADRIVEKTFNGIVDKLFGQDSTSNTTEDQSVKTDSTVTANSSPFGGLFSTKTVDKEFEFDLILDMEFQTKDKKGKGDVIEMMAMYSTDSAYIGTEMASVMNIMDLRDMKSYAIMGGKVTVFDFNSQIEKANKRAKKQKEDETPPTFEKTGRTEKIAGYLCEEYLLKDEDITGNYWITTEVGIDPKSYAKTFAANPAFNYPMEEKGIILKMIINDTKEKTTSTLITREVITEKRRYDLSKYKANDLSKLKF